jgi:hypothetical protein
MPNLMPYTKYELTAEIKDERFDELYSRTAAQELAADLEKTLEELVAKAVFESHKLRVKSVKEQGWD